MPDSFHVCVGKAEGAASDLTGEEGEDSWWRGIKKGRLYGEVGVDLWDAAAAGR